MMPPPGTCGLGNGIGSKGVGTVFIGGIWEIGVGATGRFPSVNVWIVFRR